MIGVSRRRRPATTAPADVFQEMASDERIATLEQ
jgi:hypothetical protein